MNKKTKFILIYTGIFLFWFFMTYWYINILFKKQEKFSYFSQYDNEGKKFLFQEKLFLLKKGDKTFGKIMTLFSLSKNISFEWNSTVNLIVRNKKMINKTYGKIISDKFRHIKKITLLFKNKYLDKKKVILNSFNARIVDDLLIYEFILSGKDGKRKKILSKIRYRGEYLLFNPVFPFDRNLKLLKKQKSYLSVFYNPLTRKYEKTSYKITGKKKDFHGITTFEVVGSILGYKHHLYLTSMGELMEIDFGNGIKIVQSLSENEKESDSEENSKYFLNLKDVLKTIMPAVFKNNLLGVKND